MENILQEETEKKERFCEDECQEKMFQNQKTERVAGEDSQKNIDKSKDEGNNEDGEKKTKEEQVKKQPMFPQKRQPGQPGQPQKQQPIPKQKQQPKPPQKQIPVQQVQQVQQGQVQPQYQEKQGGEKKKRLRLKKTKRQQQQQQQQQQKEKVKLNIEVLNETQKVLEKREGRNVAEEEGQKEERLRSFLSMIAQQPPESFEVEEQPFEPMQVLQMVKHVHGKPWESWSDQDTEDVVNAFRGRLKIETKTKLIYKSPEEMNMYNDINREILNRRERDRAFAMAIDTTPYFPQQMPSSPQSFMQEFVSVPQPQTYEFESEEFENEELNQVKGMEGCIVCSEPQSLMSTSYLQEGTSYVVVAFEGPAKSGTPPQDWDNILKKSPVSATAVDESNFLFSFESKEDALFFLGYVNGAGLHGWLMKPNGVTHF